MQIDIWSDVMCPWCAVGRVNLQAALSRWRDEAGEPIEVRWRSFELQPDAPRVVEGDYVEKLARKYGVPRGQAQDMVDTMQVRGRSLGIPMDFSHIRPGNSFDAHRLLHLAQEHGCQDDLKGRLFQAYLCDGKAVGTHEVLRELAIAAGLPESEVDEVLGSDRYAREVRGDEVVAQQIGVQGVPFFVLDQRVALSGAQPPEVLLQALQHTVATREEHGEAVSGANDGDACGPDGCAI